MYNLKGLNARKIAGSFVRKKWKTKESERSILMHHPNLLGGGSRYCKNYIDNFLRSIHLLLGGVRGGDLRPLRLLRG
jgi:hypothetical protein